MTAQQIPDKITVDTGTPWYKDPSILRRLKHHEELSVEGYDVATIAVETDVSLSTAYQDRKRLEELWLWYIGDDLEKLRSISARTYRQVQKEAWSKFREGGQATWLKIILDAEDRMAKLLGLEAPRRTKIDQTIEMTWGDPLRANGPAHHQIIEGETVE